MTITNGETYIYVSYMLLRKMEWTSQSSPNSKPPSLGKVFFIILSFLSAGDVKFMFYLLEIQYNT